MYLSEVETPYGNTIPPPLVVFPLASGTGQVCGHIKTKKKELCAKGS